MIQDRIFPHRIVESSRSRIIGTSILIVAVAAGAILRFGDLDGAELSTDEAIMWASAVAPTMSELVHLHARWNPGELPVYEPILRLWIALFGPSTAALRALPAFLGTLAIAMVFAVARELFRPITRGGHPDAAAPNVDIGLIPASSALILALNHVTLKYSGQARMYSLVLVVILAQVLFLIRVARRGRFPDYLGLALLTPLAVGVTFTAACVMVAEAIWLLLAGYFAPYEKMSPAAAWRTIAIMAVGGLLLLPFLIPEVGLSFAAVRPAISASSSRRMYRNSIGYFGCRARSSHSRYSLR